MTVERPRILVIGYNAFDVVVPVAGLPRSDTKVQTERIYLGGGGPGATAAVTLARLGAAVRLVSPLTDDLPGRMQRAELEAAGVDLSLCPDRSGRSSPLAVILADPKSQERTIFWSRGELPAIDPREVDGTWLEEADLLYTDGHETEVARCLALAAGRRGLPVVMDAGSVRPGSAELVAACTDVISSARFAPDLSGRDDPVAALCDLAERGPRHVAMTLGADGVLALVGEGAVLVRAFAVPVKDTTGAGDVFHAGYAFARAQGMDFLDCLDFGNATAAIKCRDWGGRRGLPTPAEVAELLRRGERRLPRADLAARVRCLP